MRQSLTKTNLGLSYCRALATIAIITLHTGFVLSTHLKFKMMDNIILRIFVNCSMWAVPVFLMVTGSLLLDENRKLTLNKLLKKYVVRILLSIVIFVAIYQIVDILLDNKKINLKQLLIYIENLYRGKSYSPMWYLYMLIGLYLMMPMYRAFIKASDKNEIKFILFVYIIFISIIPIIGVFKFKSGFYIHELTIYPFYLFVGYALNKGIVRINKYKATILFLISTIILSVLTYYRWIINYANLEVFWGYSSPIVIIQSIGIFTLIMGYSKSLEWQNIKNNIGNDKTIIKNFSYLLKKIDENSFGIYLVHIILIRIFINGHILTNLINSLPIYFTLSMLVIINLILSYFIVIIIKKLPIFKSIL